MKRILSLAAGFAAGYVVGARAGREKYEEIQRKVRQFGAIPAVSETRTALRGRIDSASHTVAEKIAETPADTSAERVSGLPPQTERAGRNGEGLAERRTVFPATGIIDGGAEEVLP